MTALRDRLAQIVLGGLLQLLQDHRGDFGGEYFLSLPSALMLTATRSPSRTTRIRHHLHFLGHFVEAPAHEALDGEHRVLGIGDGLALGDLSDQPLARLGEAHDRRRQPPASELVMTTGSPPSMTATTELVVPRSIPMILLMTLSLCRERNNL